MGLHTKPIRYSDGSYGILTSWVEMEKETQYTYEESVLNKYMGKHETSLFINTMHELGAIDLLPSAVHYLQETLIPYTYNDASEDRVIHLAHTILENINALNIYSPGGNTTFGTQEEVKKEREYTGEWIDELTDEEYLELERYMEWTKI